MQLSTPMPKSLDSIVGTHSFLLYLYLKILSYDSFRRLRGPKRSVGSSLKPSGTQKLTAQGVPSSLPKYSAILRHWMPCRIQKARTRGSSLASVRPSASGCEKNVGLKSMPRPRFFANSIHLRKCFGSILSRSTFLPSSKIA